MSSLHFDTNALIALPEWVRLNHPAVQHIQNGGQAAACAVVWYEFLCGPVSEQHKNLAYAVLNGRIEPVTEVAAKLAAELFNFPIGLFAKANNKSGRARRLRTDALIACAITANAKFATLNHADFRGFVQHGLRLVEN